ncbi:MFS transporter [Hahella sp. HN01]|uniref:MFS transporter n=1 Tax=Hahella sp. HN01 TaxID=2847262 RepID=UPI001C1EC71C|nr:MFS transporter [Hahella sp. HN01]
MKVAFLFLLGVVVVFQYSKFPIIVPYLSSDMGMTIVEANSILSMISFIGIFFGAYLASLVKKLSVEVIVTRSLVVASLASLAMYFTTESYAFVFLRVVEGITNILMMIAIPTLLFKVCKNNTNVVMALWGAVFGVGFAAANVIFPYIISIFSWDAVFLAHSLMLLCLLAAYLSVYHKPAEAAPVQANTDGFGLSIYKRLLTHRPYQLIMIVFLCFTLMYISSVSMITSFLSENASEGIDYATSIIFICTLLGVLSVLVTSYLISRNVSPLLMIAISAVFIGVNAAYLFDTDNLSPLHYCIHFLFLGVFEGAVFSLVTLVAFNEHDMIEIKSGYIHTGNFGSFFGPIVASLFVANGDWDNLKYLFAAVAVAALIFSLLSYVRLEVKLREVATQEG